MMRVRSNMLIWLYISRLLSLKLCLMSIDFTRTLRHEFLIVIFLL